MRQVVLDTETTGLEVELQHRVIEIGCVELVNRRLTGRTYHQYLNPERDIDEGAQQVHGLSRETLAKQPLFGLEERIALIRQAADDPAVEVRSFDGLLADFARAAGASVIVRGLRAVSDFAYEFQMALMNRNLAPGVETVFLVPAFDLTYLSSSLVREVARFHGDVSSLVHPSVEAALNKKFPRE